MRSLRLVTAAVAISLMSVFAAASAQADDGWNWSPSRAVTDGWNW